MAMEPKDMPLAVSNANNQLGISLLKCLSKEAGNVFISPFSLSTALAMLHCGSRGETRQEMRKVFGYEDVKLADDDVRTAFSHLLAAWNNIPESCVLSCANSMVIDKKFSVKDEYKDLLQESFNASLFEANFGTDSEKAVQDINNWVKEETKGMIPQLLSSLDPMTVMVLLNAIYFKGTWVHKFNEDYTRSGPFYNGGLKQNAKQVRMMHQTDRFGYAKKESFAILLLPYLGEGIAMMILLPSSFDGLRELEAQLTSELLKGLNKELRITTVKVSLPKFKFEYSKNMTDTLKLLGMSGTFEWGANLGGINDSKLLKVSVVFHKAVVEVNEEGTEAAAATAIVTAFGCARPQFIPEFIVDHPFLFAIYDTKNDMILFLGRMEKL